MIVSSGSGKGETVRILSAWNAHLLYVSINILDQSAVKMKLYSHQLHTPDDVVPPEYKERK